MRISILTILLVTLINSAFSQNCSNLIGQNPSHAIPVCGTAPFHQDGAASCTGVLNIPHSGCTVSVTSDNSFWYKFHCYQTGTLGFIINGTIATADYDWEVFDLFGHTNPDDVFTDATMQVSLNLYGVSTANPPFPNYPTGCTSAGVGNVHCDGETNPFNAMPVILAGHDYLLMVTNYNQSGSGYDLTFTGGNAVITDPVSPAVLNATASCDNLHVTVKLNKKMLCTSLAVNGTDFSINYPGTSIINAASASCSANFDTDSLILTLSNPLPPGTYQVTAQNGTDGNTMFDYCDNRIPVGNAASFNVEGQAVANFTVSGNYCANNAITFTDASTPVGDLTRWHWNMGDATILDLTNGNPFTHIYAASGTYTVTLQVTNSLGCVSAVFSRQIVINALPSASVAGTTTVCLNAPAPVVTFTGTGGTAPYTFSYTINGIAQTPVVSNNAGVYTIAVPTAAAGVYVYAVTNVQESSTSLCSRSYNSISATVTVKDLPTASVSGNALFCLNATGANITFTGSGGTAPYTFNYTVNGNPFTISTTAASNSVTLPVPTNIATTYMYIITNVQEGSVSRCSQAQNSSFVVTINPLPTASIAGNATVCLNAPSPTITFTGSNGTAPYTFNYTINGNPFNISTTAASNSVTLAVPTNIANTFIYALTGVQEGSTAACSQSQGGSVTVIVKPLPSATITGNAAVCVNGPSPTITFTGSGGTAPYTFAYAINGVPQAPVISNAAGVHTIAAPTATAGPYIYTITNVQESSASLCSQDLNISATVTVNALPTATISGSTEICAGSAAPSITFTGSGGTPPYTFTYNVTVNGTTFPNQTVTGNPATVTAAIPPGMWLPTPGNPNLLPFYTYVYTLVSVHESSSLLCGQPQTGTATVIVNQKPWTNAAVIAPYCDSRTINFYDVLTYPPPQQVINLVSWTWDFGDPASGANNTSTLQNPTHIYSAPGVYTITHTSTSDKGCTGGGFLGTITVNERPHADFILPEVCLNDTYAQFTDASHISTGTLSWEWDFGDANANAGNPNTSTQQNPKHSYTATGPYNVRLIITSNLGCKDTVTKQLFVNGSFPKSIFSVANEAGLCVNKPVTITNSSTVFPGNITKLEIFWDDVNAPAVVQTDNNPFAGSVYTYTYPDFNSPPSKTMNIHVRAYAGGVCANDSIHTITLYASPKVQFDAIPDTCLLSAPFQLKATEIGGVPGTGVYTGTGVSTTGIFSPQVAGVGTHTITYTYTSAAGCVDIKTSTIKVLDTASARFSYVIPACDRAAITFNDESAVPAGVINANTIWDFNDGSPTETHIAGAPFTHVFPGWGTYMVKMFTRSAYGCNSTVFTKAVTVHPIPVPDFGFPASVCLPHGTITFNNTSSIADGTEKSFIYLWHFGDAASGAADSSHAINPAHTYITTGPFNVNLQITSGAGCKHDTTIVLDVIHPQPKVVFSTNRKTACLGENIIFTNNTDPLQGTTAAINWDLGDNTILHTQTVDHTYLDTLTYRVSLYIVNSIGCNSDTAYKDIKVYPNPVVNAGPDRVVLEGATVRMNPTVSGVEMKYLWTPNVYFNNGNNTILAPAAINVTSDITYTLQVFARGGCMRMDEMYIKVLKNPIIPNTFTPNGDGINEKWEITYLKDFPNSKVQVFTRAGQKVFESEGYSKPWDGMYKGKPLPFDTYYYIIEPGSGHDPLTGYVTILK